jgi:hypothetical protein
MNRLNCSGLRELMAVHECGRSNERGGALRRGLDLLLLVTLAGVGCGSDDDDGNRGPPFELCEQDSDCADDEYCEYGDVPARGTCTQSCTSASECQAVYGAGAGCSVSSCVESCDDSPCSEGYRCGTSAWICIRDTCELDDHCFRYRCDGVTGTCFHACTSSSECNLGYTCYLEPTSSFHQQCVDL